MKEKKFCKFCGTKIDNDSLVCPECGKQLKENKKENKEENKKENKKEVISEKKEVQKKFYEQQWFMWVMLVLFAPVGIFLMWRFNDKMTKGIKIILSIVFAILFLSVMTSGGDESISENEISTNNNSNNSSEVSKEQVEIIDFSSMSEHEILNWCNEKNLDCQFEREYSNTVPKDGYISQSVNAGEKVNENTIIFVTYSLGKEPTVAQQNAVRKAEEYLNVMPFSKSGLIEQLEFEGFTNEEAVYGVNNVSVDWNEQAVKKAEEYLDIMPFSRSGLIEQLEFEGFTYEQAVYGVEQNGL